jgi:hypothetical protein
VKSSISEFCTSPLSNVVAGIGDAGMPIMLIKRSATLKPNQVAFIVLDLARPGSTIPATVTASSKLLRVYLAIGAKICRPPASDREFSTIDFLTLLDLRALPAIIRAHFLR